MQQVSSAPTKHGSVGGRRTPLVRADVVIGRARAEGRVVAVPMRVRTRQLHTVAAKVQSMQTRGTDAPIVEVLELGTGRIVGQVGAAGQATEEVVNVLQTSQETRENGQRGQARA